MKIKIYKIYKITFLEFGGKSYKLCEAALSRFCLYAVETQMDNYLLDKDVTVSNSIHINGHSILRIRKAINFVQRNRAIFQMST